MIIIITGASHTGKTCLAQKMLEKYKYPYLSVDHLKMGLIRSKNTSLTPCDEKELTDYLWPIVREMIKTSFEDEYLSQIRFVGLALTEQYIDAHFTDIIGHGSDIEARLDDSDCTVEWIKAENRSFINEFQPNNTIVLIDDDYEKTIEGLLTKKYYCCNRDNKSNY